MVVCCPRSVCGEDGEALGRALGVRVRAIGESAVSGAAGSSEGSSSAAWAWSASLGAAKVVCVFSPSLGGVQASESR